MLVTRESVGCEHLWQNGEGEPSPCPECLEAEVAKLRRLVSVLEQRISGARSDAGMAYHKLSCVALERGCPGVPEIVQVCDRQAMDYLSDVMRILEGK